MPRPVHFEISADKPEQVARFYTDVFGWKFDKWEGPMEYWMITTGAQGERGIDGGLARRRESDSGTVNTIEVSSLDETVRKIERSGGKTVAPRMAIPSIGWLAYCQDPEGTTFGVLQPDPAAA